MNFLQFLKLDESEILKHNLSIPIVSIQKTKTKIIKEKKFKIINNCKEKNEDDNEEDKSEDTEIIEVIKKEDKNSLFKTYDNKQKEYRDEIAQYRRGDFIRIKGVKDSILNEYKGYNGEIKTYMKDSEYATVILEALNYPTPIIFPINHFYKLT